MCITGLRLGLLENNFKDKLKDTLNFVHIKTSTVHSNIVIVTDVRQTK